MSLDEELERTRGFASAPPGNEEATCQWVIVPLLYRMGYARDEVVPQARDQGGKVPDYTILPGTEHTWFLEAKKWSRDLGNDADLVQALNYANTAGKRWVVLTNGCEWRLYDNHRYDRPACDRLVAQARLENDAEIRPFLQAISRGSVTNGGPAGYAARESLARALDDQLAQEGSEVVRAIRSALRKCRVDATTGDIVRYFVGRVCGPQSTTGEPAPGTKPIGGGHQSGGAKEGGNPPLSPTGREERSLEEWRSAVVDDGRGVVDFTQPTTVQLPGQPAQGVSSWKEVAVTVVAYVMASDSAPPLPYSATQRGTNVFLNTVPRHRDNRKAMICYADIRVGSRTVYMDANRSAETFVRTLWSLCRAVGIDPAAISIKIERRGCGKAAH